MYSNIRK